MKKLNQLTKKIQEAVPEIKKWKCERCNGIFADYVNGCPKCETGEVGGSASVYPYIRPITLEDILIAVDWLRPIKYSDTPNRIKLRESRNIFWKLNKPLHEQSKETINFLNDLL